MDYELGVWILCQRVERARRIRDRNASGDSRVSDGSNVPNVLNGSNSPKISDVSAETLDAVAETSGPQI
jgi:hypothetical protein